ncbi:restriction endonuclease subunit S [Providencia alcalifaciens]|uniref:restriction endonuclease subunit S n=1 Tax=Providencia alcalifaciens TaxID=126385 RepID=UPI00029BED24|nr:restriction endonuclease subunit S [Providencia alcalifaciens]EKT65500.1 putative type I restriction enzyme, S subunit [Providencia alcalifaciens Dmel2]
MKSPRLNFKNNELYQEQRLGEVTQWFSGGTPSKSNPDYWDGNIDWHTASSLKNTLLHFSETKISKLGLENGSRIAEANSILLLVRGSILFKKIPIGMLSRPAAFNQDVKSINCNHQLLPQYLLQWLLAKEHQLLGMVVGTGIGAGKLETDSLKNLKILYPCIELQAKTADFLSSVDEKIALQNRKVELLQQYKKGMMQKLFSQKIRFKGNDGDNFQGWMTFRLSEIGKSFNGLTGKTAKDFGKGADYITYKQIFDDRVIDVTKFEKVNIDANESQSTVKFGDSFFTTSSETPNEVGFSATLLDELLESTYLNSFCFGFRPDSFDKLLPEFSPFLFGNESFRKKVILLAQGSTRFNISKNKFMEIKVDLPCIEEQRKIANCLSSIDDKITLENTQLNQLKQWKQGLLQQMFV